MNYPFLHIHYRSIGPRSTYFNNILICILSIFLSIQIPIILTFDSNNFSILQFLRFLYERTGHLYKKYRARVAELKRSFEETKQEPSRPGPSTSAQSQPGLGGRIKMYTLH